MEQDNLNNMNALISPPKIMTYEILIKNELWLIDLPRRLLIKKDDPKVVRELNLDEIDWYREYIETMYSRRLRENRVF